LFIELAAIWAP